MDQKAFMEMVRERFVLSSDDLLQDSRLTEAQRRTLAAAVGILEAHRAVLLCEMTGTGKTYVACALASYIQKTRHIGCHVVAPAHLLAQWRSIAAQFELSCAYYSYHAASRNAIAHPCRETLWLVDEAHYLKNMCTQRYRVLRELFLPHLVCLITATPVSMGYGDLYALMVLCGFPCLTGSPDEAYVRAFALAVMPQTYASPLKLDAHLSKSDTAVTYRITDRDDMLAELMDTLRSIAWITVDANGDCISGDIVSHVLVHRLLSHRVACAATLAKLAKYYQNCCIRRQFLSREQFRSLAGIDGTQLLLPFEDYAYGRALDDDEISHLARSRERIAHARHQLDGICRTRDGKLAMVQDIIDRIQPDDRIVMFTQYADTARYFGRHLVTDVPIAVVTAQAAWYNGHRADAHLLMAMFSPHGELPDWWKRSGFAEARILICTDALACGHNFHRAGCLLHLDYPWNPTVLCQREGRLLRKGQLADRVRVIRPRVIGCDDVESCEQQLVGRLGTRQRLQHTWLDQTRVAANEIIFVPDRSVPGLWCRAGDVFVPVAPCCIDWFRVRAADCVPVSAAFLPAARNAQTQEIWRKFKRQRHVPSSAGRLVAGLIAQVLLPKHHAYAHFCAQLNGENRMFTCFENTACAEADVLHLAQSLVSPDLACFRARIYPQYVGVGSQEIHKLSTGLRAVCGEKMREICVNTEN